MVRRALLLAAVVSLLLAADAPTKNEPAKPAKEEKEGPNLPEGAIHVALPPGTIAWERIIRNEKPLLRLTVGKTVIEARNVFIGDGKSATEFEATKDGIYWPAPKGGQGQKFGASMSWEGGKLRVPAKDFRTVEGLKPGSVYLTTNPKGTATPPDKVEKNNFNLAEGVIHVSLPPGTIRWVRVFNHGKPVLRVSVGETVVEARDVFIGDGKAGTMYEGTKDGIYWRSVPGGEGPLYKDGRITEEGGTTVLRPGDFVPVDKLKPGSLYLTSQNPNIKFVFTATEKEWKELLKR